jgi:hypothetical protein
VPLDLENFGGHETISNQGFSLLTPDRAGGAL